MSESPVRAHLHRQLEAHLTRLGYSSVRVRPTSAPAPRIVRVSPVRGRIAYGETVLHSDLESPRCHERLLCFSQRRTRHRASILFFIGVAEADQDALETLLEHLAIRSNIRGGHVHVVPIALPGEARQRAGGAPDPPARRRRSKLRDTAAADTSETSPPVARPSRSRHAS